MTFDPADDLNPAWSADGSRIAFTSNRKGTRDLYQKLANGAGDDELLLESKENKAVEDWLPDGKLVFNLEPRDRSTEVWMLESATGATALHPTLLLRGPSGRDQVQVSPDGRWIAYRSLESGRSEVFVETFPPSNVRWQVSTNGGREPRWRGDSRELYYLDGVTMKAVSLKASGAGLEPGIPTTLFAAPIDPQEMRRNRYVVTQDGQRFLLLTALPASAQTLNVVVNWRRGLGR